MKKKQNRPKATKSAVELTNRGLYTSPTKRAQAVGLYLAGWTKSKIVRETGLHRTTVTRIVSQPEVQTLTFRERVMKIVPDAIAGLHVLVRELDRTAIIETLYGSKVFSKRRDVDVSRRQEERTYAYPKALFIAKYKRLPTKEELLAFDKTLPAEAIVKAPAE
jgi:Homeodomain-like domain-containing protein